MKYCLYVSYDGLLDPLGQSQIIPYLRNLNKNGYKFIIFSYEKIEKNKIQIRLLKKDLEKEGFEWIILPFKKRRKLQKPQKGGNVTMYDDSHVNIIYELQNKKS